MKFVKKEPACKSESMFKIYVAEQKLIERLLDNSRHAKLTDNNDNTNNRALKSREISRENTGIFAHMWHQRSLLGANQYGPLTLNDHWRSKAIKVA